MNRKIKLKKFFDSAHTDMEYIAEFELNQDYIEEVISDGILKDLEIMIPIKLLKYADPVNKSGNYSKALKLTLEVESSLKRMKKSTYYKHYLEYALFLKAVCLGRLKKYSESNEIFKELLIKNPDNEKFADWYRANQKDKIQRVLNPLIYSGIGIYIIMLSLDILGIVDNSNSLQRTSILVGFSAYVVAYVLKKWYDKRELKFEK